MMLDACIVGVAKAGTTSIADMLRQHPEIDFSSVKEPHYFWPGAKDYCGPADASWKMNISRDEKNYWSLFSNSGLKVESTGYISNVDALCALHANNPDIKIILILRDPVDRAVSAFRHLKRDSFEPCSFEKALELEEKRYRSKWGPLYWYRRLSDYKEQIENLLNIYERRNILFLLFEDLITNPKENLECVEEFLGISHADLDLPKMNVGVTIKKDFYVKFFISSVSNIRNISRRILPGGLSSFFGRKALMHIQKNFTEKVPVNDKGKEALYDLYDDIPIIEALTNLPCSKYWG